jgi:L-seryl-tRNA(Ser) seleniumtransferase
MDDLQVRLRQLDGVDALLRRDETAAWIAAYGRELVLGALRGALEEARRAILRGDAYPGAEATLERARQILEDDVQPTLRPVINATGVVLHTNLGRAPLSDATLAAMQQAGASYSNLEFDLAAGQRGSRYVHAEALLCRLTGAEAALVVNNNAGAVLLALSALARGREVIISRGQLVEIGGGFRIPDVMAQSGARMVEVGTTNRTYARDYAEALGDETVALMRVHASNFRIQGFAHQPSLAELAELAHERGCLLLDDLGSGTLLDTALVGLPHEPTVQESLAAGADLVTFSGDKLLGGPQAGLLVGRRDLIEQLRRHPLTRALRVDKITLAGIQANLLHYLIGEALEQVPIWRMMALGADEIARRGRTLLEALGALASGCELLAGRSMIGGGSLPEESLPTTLIALPPGDATALAARLRGGQPPVVARIQEERVVLDLRTVLPREEPALLARLREILA